MSFSVANGTGCRIYRCCLGWSGEFAKYVRFSTAIYNALLVTIEHPFPSLPDPDDEPIVTSALAGNANVFVTGDKALLQLHNVEHLPIVSPRNFWKMLAGRQ